MKTNVIGMQIDDGTSGDDQIDNDELLVCAPDRLSIKSTDADGTDLTMRHIPLSMRAEGRDGPCAAISLAASPGKRSLYWRPNYEQLHQIRETCHAILEHERERESGVVDGQLPDQETMQRIINEHRARGEQPMWHHFGDDIIMGVAQYGDPNVEWEPIVIDGRFRGYRKIETAATEEKQP